MASLLARWESELHDEPHHLCVDGRSICGGDSNIGLKSPGSFPKCPECMKVALLNSVGIEGLCSHEE